MLAMEYLTENDIQEESVKKEIFELVETMNSMGLSNKSNLKHTTISEINYHHTESITEHGLQMLEKKFRIKCADITSFHAGIPYSQIVISHTMIKVNERQL